VTRLTLFTHVPVVPVTKVHQHVALGGPIWPGFDMQTWIRHCRERKPSDAKPDMPDRLTPFDQPAVWGGFLDSHFGHFVAEHLPRLAASLRERPGDMYLFTVDPGMTRQALAPWVWQIFDWIGLPAAQVHLVTEALYVAELRVAPQAEMLAQVPPKRGYLDLIAPWAGQVAPVACPLLYVSRQGFAAKGGGAHAGEGYLVGLLHQAGVAVLDPGRTTIAVQMAAYVGARRLVFAEGSALHGRQLLGFLPQEIEVLQRRPGKVMAKAALRPRCNRLTYHDVGAGQLMAYWRNGAPRPDPALCLYDVPRLLQVFQGFGVDLAGLWDADAYLRAVQSDIQGWTAAQSPKPRQLAEHRAVLQGLGLDAPM
jgi:hypothetical protein